VQPLALTLFRFSSTALFITLIVQLHARAHESARDCLVSCHHLRHVPFAGVRAGAYVPFMGAAGTR
jgi:hypothetical protein